MTVHGVSAGTPCSLGPACMRCDSTDELMLSQQNKAVGKNGQAERTDLVARGCDLFAIRVGQVVQEVFGVLCEKVSGGKSGRGRTLERKHRLKERYVGVFRDEKASRSESQ
jgi:hypothetical protein